MSKTRKKIDGKEFNLSWGLESKFFVALGKEGIVVHDGKAVVDRVHYMLFLGWTLDMGIGGK